MTSEPELAAVLRLAANCGNLVNIGHGRNPGAVACAEAFARRWCDSSGEIGVIVSWPATAASWLRPARRLASGGPDAWVIADDAEGWARLAPRLAATGSWRPRHTIAFSGLADPELVARAGAEATEGLRAVRRDGSVMEFTAASVAWLQPGPPGGVHRNVSPAAPAGPGAARPTFNVQERPT